MTKHASQWLRVASISDVPIGEAKAVRLGEGRSIAIFNVEGRIFATDNQCPQMGYPLTRGAVRTGYSPATGMAGASIWKEEDVSIMTAAQTAQRFARGQTAVDLYES